MMDFRYEHVAFFKSDKLRLLIPAGKKGDQCAFLDIVTST